MVSSLWSRKLLSRQVLGLSLCIAHLRCCLSSIDGRLLNVDSHSSSAIASNVRPLPSLVPPDHITCVLSDMDGTLLSSKHRVEDRTLQAVSRIMRLGYKFFPCTGRSRRSMSLVAGPRFINVSIHVVLKLSMSLFAYLTYIMLNSFSKIMLIIMFIFISFVVVRRDARASARGLPARTDGIWS